MYTQYPYIYIVYVYKYGECSQVVRQWIVVPSFAGSNPVIRPSYVCNALSYVRLSLTAMSLTPISAKTPLTKLQNIHIFMYMCSSKYKLASESILSLRHKCSVLARQTYFHFVRSTHVQSPKPPSSRGQGHFLFAEETRVRVPLGVNKKGVIAQLVERVAYTDNVSGSNPFYPIYDTLASLCLRMHRYAYCLTVCTARGNAPCRGNAPKGAGSVMHASNSFTQYLRRCT